MRRRPPFLVPDLEEAPLIDKEGASAWILIEAL